MGTFKISRNNPLYKLALYWSEEDYKVPTNICPFMRHAVYGVFKGIFMTVMVLIVITVVDCILVGGVWSTCYLIFDSFGVVDFDRVPWLQLGGAFFIIVGFASVILITIAIVKAMKFWMNHRKDKYADRPPSVVAEYVKARHSRICVPIEFD